VNWGPITNKLEAVSSIQRSETTIGQIYPVILDKYGEIIDGRCRLKADPNWPKIQLQNVQSDEQRILTRLISNLCRQDISPNEKTEMLKKLGQFYLKSGVEPNKLIKTISEKTGMSYRWVMKYAPNNLKIRPGLGGPKKLDDIYKNDEKFYISQVDGRATDTLLLEPEERVATVSNYSNTKFANLMIEQSFYSKLKAVAQELDVDPNVIINNALIFAFKRVDKVLKESRISQVISS